MRFSVIIPLYNKAPYVKKALESVLGQTFRDFELIVVDDGSGDGSLDVAKTVLEGSAITNLVLHQENSGVSITRNNGVAVSTGEFICFLDADDWWAPSFLEKMDALIRSFPDAGIYGSNYYYVKNGRQRECIKNVKTGYINYCRVYADSLAMPLTSISVAIPRNVFDEMKGFRPHLRLGEDFDLWIKIALKYKVVFLNEPLAYYYQDSNHRWRGTGHLVNPQFHMLWNLDYLSDYESSNSDYKRLIDLLRTKSLLRYHIAKEYRSCVATELRKVDWSRQSKRVKLLYELPIFILVIRRELLSLGSKVKQGLISVLLN